MLKNIAINLTSRFHQQYQIVDAKNWTCGDTFMFSSKPLQSPGFSIFKIKAWVEGVQNLKNSFEPNNYQ